jgi:CDP-diacylglycerol--inositol 3-phosphatidyltransferase
VPLRSFVQKYLMIAMALSWKDFWTRHGYPALYVPQLLGYARIALALHAFAVAMVRPSQTVSLYALSFVCDELDGRFARMLGQSTQFGALLDMVTDRVATTGLAAIVYARAVAVLDADTVCPVALVLFSLVALDIFSHWMHMTSVHAGHGIKTSHKETRSSQPVGSRALAHRSPLAAHRRRSPPPPRFAARSVVDPAVL